MHVHLTAIQWILAIFSGGIVGFSLGLLGGGGSIMAVPLLMYLVGIRQAHLVIGTTALAVSLNSFLNLLPHWRAHHVRWRPAIVFAVPGIVGAAAGSALGKILNGKDLLFIFAILMVVVAIVMVRNVRRAPNSQASRGDNQQLHPGGRSPTTLAEEEAGTGFLVGALSGFFGIGGGFLIVPGLLFSSGMTMIEAVGSSLFAVGTFGLTTAVNYAISGLVSPVIALIFLMGGVSGGWAGAVLATRLSQQKGLLTYVFAGVIILMAIYMGYKNLSAI
ncbi:MAG: hypothetical protein C7B45_00635 [Sulfobacillus acidophilus]|uniref:Probable membrane transporter protein n=1 Tax=Sulfobacillus acidophilus TaxID=53633 RepID=A0A2T2WPI7_9FIRM|nr:MAG: hypothetical protein C7B45_00635 [Sulfobacillus acidophilus]